MARSHCCVSEMCVFQCTLLQYEAPPSALQCAVKKRCRSNLWTAEVRAIPFILNDPPNIAHITCAKSHMFKPLADIHRQNGTGAQNDVPVMSLHHRRLGGASTDLMSAGGPQMWHREAERISLFCLAT